MANPQTPEPTLAERANAAVSDLSQRASATASDLGDRASAGLDASPLIALAGGVAVGALVAALLPQSEKETDLLRPAGSKVADAGRQAADRVREAGKAKVDELAGDKVRDFFGLNKAAAE